MKRDSATSWLIDSVHIPRGCIALTRWRIHAIRASVQTKSTHRCGASMDHTSRFANRSVTEIQSSVSCQHMSTDSTDRCHNDGHTIHLVANAHSSHRLCMPWQLLKISVYHSSISAKPRLGLLELRTSSLCIPHPCRPGYQIIVQQSRHRWHSRLGSTRWRRRY